MNESLEDHDQDAWFAAHKVLNPDDTWEDFQRFRKWLLGAAVKKEVIH